MNHPSGRDGAPPPDVDEWRYQAPPTGFDEVLDGTGGPRPGWSRLLAGVEARGPEGLRLQADQVRRLLRENGVTYNVYADPRGVSRPWELDVLPLIIDSAEGDVILACPALADHPAVAVQFDRSANTS